MKILQYWQKYCFFDTQYLYNGQCTMSLVQCTQLPKNEHTRSFWFNS